MYLNHIKTIQANGLKLFHCIKPFDNKLAGKIFTCTQYPITEGFNIGFSGRRCNFRFCPRCNWSNMLQYVKLLTDAYNSGTYCDYMKFVTYTWAKGLDPYDIDSIRLRMEHFKFFSSKNKVWKAEYTQRQDSTLHFHIHSVQDYRDSNKILAFFQYGIQNVHVDNYDGNTYELLKYLADPSTFDMTFLMHTSLKKYSVRLRGKSGYSMPKLETPRFLERLDSLKKVPYIEIIDSPTSLASHIDEIMSDIKRNEV